MVKGRKWTWSSNPKGKWECDSSTNSCVAHTGFRPNAGTGPYGPWWGQARNPKGNCTAYAAYRLIKNNAKDRGFRGSGGAKNWRRVVDGTVYLSDSSWPTKPGIGGSSRKAVRKGDWWWPDAFLHVKDAPMMPTNPRGNLDRVDSPSTGKVRVVGWAFDPNKKTRPVSIHVYVGGKAGGKALRHRPSEKEEGRRVADLRRSREEARFRHDADDE